MPFVGPSRTSAGFDPNIDGEVAITLPFAMVKWSDTWWPSTRHPHGVFVDGVPNTEKK